MALEILGVPMAIWHSLVVEEHTGVIVFIVLTLAARILVDVRSRGQTATPMVEEVRNASDAIAYYGSMAAVFFLILSGVTGYLIYPYSTLVAQPILINKSLLALASLFFWTAFFFLRYWYGPGLWERRGLYAVYVLTAFIGLVFTAVTASVGAELTLGQSALQPVYSALDFSWNSFTVQPLEIGVTLALVVVGVAVAVFALLRARPAEGATGRA